MEAIRVKALTCPLAMGRLYGQYTAGNWRWLRDDLRIDRGYIYVAMAKDKRLDTVDGSLNLYLANLRSTPASRKKAFVVLQPTLDEGHSQWCAVSL